MNLSYTLKLLAAADEQPYGFIKLRGAHADYEVRRMVESGLVEATLSDGQAGSFTSINRLTDLGEKFLSAFPDRSIPAPILVVPKTQPASKWQSDFSAPAIGKWKVNFAAGLPRLEQAAA